MNTTSINTNNNNINCGNGTITCNGLTNNAGLSNYSWIYSYPATGSSLYTRIGTFTDGHTYFDNFNSTGCFIFRNLYNSVNTQLLFLTTTEITAYKPINTSNNNINCGSGTVTCGSSIISSGGEVVSFMTLI
jgi:hypothetical protein